MKKWFLGLSKAGKVIVISVASVISVGTLGAFANRSPDPSDTTPTTIQSQTKQEEPPTPEITTNQVTETEPVAFETTTTNNANLAQGTTRVAIEGVDGVRTIVYEVTYQDGKETSRKEVSNSITQQPVAKVIENGTKAPTPKPTPAAAATDCPNGTYINSAGNTVCRPYATNSAPAGATAKCRDGTYSFSQSRRGTCSGHGGVAQWL